MRSCTAVIILQILSFKRTFQSVLRFQRRYTQFLKSLIPTHLNIQILLKASINRLNFYETKLYIVSSVQELGWASQFQNVGVTTKYLRGSHT